MSTHATTASHDVHGFDAWLGTKPSSPRVCGRSLRPGGEGLRFAFYGRISTGGFQDPESSRSWQLEAASRLVAGRGRIVAEFFDVDTSRSLPWARRPQAAELLAAITGGDPGFDAVVVGEFERAFAGGEAPLVIALLESYGIQLWLPEARGPIDLTMADHRALLLLLGHQSEREVLRCRVRACAAMTAQVHEQGRNPGGRPPYGYRLVDAGPHPNGIHASWGRRLHRLAVDTTTAPHVRWMFVRRLEGMSTAGIARMLNDRGIPSPGAYDRTRNPHRSGSVWTLRTVAAILANPRYTGRQVWNRQHTDHREAVPGDKRSSHGPVRIWNARTDWVVSRDRTHPALVSDADFLTAQDITAIPQPANSETRRYALTGLLICGICGRRLEGHWVNGKPAYRCRHGHTSAHPANPDQPRWVYWSQARLVRDLLATDDLAHLAETDGLAAYLKSRDSVIVCGHRTLTIDDTGDTDPTPTDEATPASEPPNSESPNRKRLTCAITGKTKPPPSSTETVEIPLGG